MSVYNNLAIICNLYEKCNGDLEKTKRKYKTTYGRHITDRHIMKALTRKFTDPAVKEAQVEYIDCIQENEEEEQCEVDIIECFEDPFSEDQKLPSTEMDPKLVYYPVVYTTRLEDMHIFNNNLENISLSSIVEQVEAESKPNLISDTLFQRTTFIKNSISFSELVNKLKQFNAAATTSCFQNSDEINHGLISYVKTEPEDFTNEINREKDRSLIGNELGDQGRTVSGLRRSPARSPQPRSESTSEPENSKEAMNRLVTPIKTTPFHMSKNKICNKTKQIKPSTSNSTLINIKQTNNGLEKSIKTEPEESLNDIILDKLEKLKASTSTRTLQNSKESNIELITSKGTESQDVLSDNEFKDSLKDKIRKLCKPLSVKLVDCKYHLKVNKSNKLCKVHKKSPLADSVRNCSKCVKTSINDGFKFVRASKVGEKAKVFWVVMKNLYSKTTEIYNMRNDHGIPIVYYRVGHVITDDRELAHYITDTIVILELSNCCWLRRYENNKKTFYGTGTSNIWTQPHPCPRDKCICCCRDTISIEISDKTLKKSFGDVKAKLTNEGNPYSIPVKEISNANNDINKALVYKRLPKPMLVEAVDNQPYRFFSIRVKNECDKTMQQYIVRLDGQVQTYLKFNRRLESRMSRLHMELTSSYDILKSFNTMTCCWVTYRNFLTNIMFNAVPVSYNFLVAPHPCPSENCHCCCKLLKSYRKLQFKPLVLPKTLSHTKRSTTKANLGILNTIKHNKLEICTSKRCLAEFETTVKANQQTDEPIRQRGGGRPPVTVVPVALLQTTESKLNQPTLPVPQAEDPAVSSLISTILDRFKNIRLTLNPNGKVTAELDTPVNDLTTGELKILSNILSHAQNQVNALGITNDGNSSISYPIASGGYSGVCIPGQANAQVANAQVANASTNTSQFLTIPTITIDGTDEFENSRKLLQETVYKNSRSTDLYDTYSKLTYFKNKQYKRSLQAFFFEKEDVEKKSSSLPQIQNTFSLNQVVKPVDNAYIKLGGSRKRKLNQSLNSNSNQETASPVAKLPKPVTDIQIVNVHSQSIKNNPITMPVAPPQAPPFVVQPQVPPPLVPSNFPYTGPMIMLNNPTNIQTFMPHMPHQILPPGAIVQRVVLPNNFMNKPMPSPAVVPIINNQTPFIEPMVKPENEPILVDDDADDDCILGV